MKYTVYGFLAATLLAAPPAAAAPCTLAGLAWMKGVWHADTGAGEERWTIATNGQLMGSSWFLDPGRAGGLIEAMTIIDEGGRPRLHLRHFNAALTHAEEPAETPMPFAAIHCEANAVTFDGEGAQKGEHMTYRLEGRHLRFTGDFLHDGKPVRDAESFTRAGD